VALNALVRAIAIDGTRGSIGSRRPTTYGQNFGYVQLRAGRKLKTPVPNSGENFDGSARCVSTRCLLAREITWMARHEAIGRVLPGWLRADGYHEARRVFRCPTHLYPEDGAHFSIGRVTPIPHNGPLRGRDWAYPVLWRPFQTQGR